MTEHTSSPPETVARREAARGDAHFLSGRYDLAEEAWREALALDSSDPDLLAKIERAATNVATRIADDEPEMERFRVAFESGIPTGGPRPGERAVPRLEQRASRGLLGRIVGGVGAGAGAAIGTVGRTLVERMADRAGAAGIDDGVWTNWHVSAGHLPERLRAPFQIMKLAFMREALFANNLVGPYADGVKTGFCETDAEPPEWARYWRTADGSWNDLRKDDDGRYDPMVGAAFTRFFRNVGCDKGLEATRPRESPGTNPVSVRELSRALLAPRGPRAEVPFLNVWAASWIQFMVHDWVSHGTPDSTHVDQVPLAADDPLRRYGIDALSVPASPADPTRCEADGDRPHTRLNEVTHWWDASQVYGSDDATQRSLRSGVDGKLALSDDGYLPIDPATGIERAGFVRNWWLGIAMLHTLFAREHNAICDHLREHYPDWDDERLFQTARLINAAEIAKIHTVEWTPGILANRTIHDAMHANWYGLLTKWFGGEQKKTLEPIPIASHEMGGIVGGPSADFARYGLSEEFTAVYRMHSLLPDALQLPLPEGGSDDVPLQRLRNAAVQQLVRRHGFEAIATAMGEQNCCALVNNNYPAALTDVTIPGMPVADLGAIDLYRDRERGVPAYNQLRAELGLKRVPSFDELCEDADAAAALRGLYGTDDEGNDRVDDVDLLIGTLCEGNRPAGFGFGETLFQVFILNASWRLLGDRFFTTDYRPEIYSPEGIAWIDRTTFKDVLLRHFPDLAEAGLGNVSNGFEPWDEGPLDPERHPTRAFVKSLANDPWSGDRVRTRST